MNVVGPAKTFDCGQCLSKCKADCCRGPIPMHESLLQRFPLKRPVIAKQEIGHGMVIVLALDESSVDNTKNTVMGCCPFLGLDNKCSIYDDRPDVCREFGSEVDAFMTCSYQARDGRVRARPERRHIERVVFVKRDEALRRNGATPEQIAALGGRLGLIKP